MKINEADYVVAVDAANYRQILTAHQAVLQERDELRAQVEQLKHTAQQLEMVLKQYTVYEWREIGETDWEICSQYRLEYYQLSPEHDTRKRIIKAAEIKAQAVEDAIEECIYCGCDGQAWRSELEQCVIRMRQQAKAGV